MRWFGLEHKKKTGRDCSSFSVEGTRPLLQFMGYPAMLVRAPTWQIVAANREAARQSGYDLPDLVQRPLGDLFPEAPWQNTSPRSSMQALTILRMPGGETREVTWRAYALDAKREHWWVLFTPYTPGALDLAHDRTTPLNRPWKKHIEALAATDPEEAYRLTLEGEVELLDARWGSLYLLEQGVLQHKVHYGVSVTLPAQIPAHQVEFFEEVTVYRPSQRAITAFHTAVRMSETAYVVIAPLRREQATVGFVSFGYQQTPPWGSLKSAQVAAECMVRVLEAHECRQNYPQVRRDLLETQAVNEAVLESLKLEGVLIFDEHFRLVTMNRAAERLLGYLQEDVHQADLTHILISNHTLEDLAHQTALTGTTQEIETVLFHREGREFLAQITFSLAVTTAVDTVPHLVVVVRDLSEKTRQEAQREELIRRAALGEILASFAHEVRNPLNSLSTGLELLAYPLSEEKRQEVFNNLQEDLKRVNRLVKNLQDHSRARPLQLYPLDIRPLIEGVLRRWEHRFRKHGIVKAYYPSPDLPKVLGDRLSLEQVFSNLIDNAIRALSNQPGERFLTVRITHQHGERGVHWVEVSVVDNGPGFSKEVAERLFEPFFTTREEGTGLGLAITKQLVTAHKGSIIAQSLPGGGTIFQVRLRAAE